MKFLTIVTQVSTKIETTVKYLKLINVLVDTLQFFNERLKKEFPNGLTPTNEITDRIKE